MTYLRRVEIESADSASIDAFGRWRTSEQFPVFQNKMLHDNAPLYWDDQEVSGSGTGSTYNANQASVTLSVGATTAGRRTRQTFLHHNYQAARSQLCHFTGVFGPAISGVSKRVGLFQDNDGLFLEVDGTGPNFVIRSSTSGSPVNNKIARANWNTDKLDGTGPSGQTIDLTKTQIFWLDYQWLGVGRVRFGFVINGERIICHNFQHANVDNVVYMSTPNLPVRYEIENDGTGAATSMTQICCSVASEGGENPVGIPRTLSTGLTSATYSAGTYARLGLRLKSTHLDAYHVFRSFTMRGGQTNDEFEWFLVLNPTIAGTVTWNNLTNSICQTFVGGTGNTLTGGTVLLSGHIIGEQTERLNALDQIQLGSAIDGTPDTLVLGFTNDNTQECFASLNWREIV